MEKLVLDEATQVAVVKNNPAYIQYIKYPCAEAQIICLKNNKANVLFIKKLNEEVAKMFNIITSEEELSIQIEKILDEHPSLTDEEVYEKLCEKFGKESLILFEYKKIINMISDVRKKHTPLNLNIEKRIDSKVKPEEERNIEYTL